MRRFDALVRTRLAMFWSICAIALSAMPAFAQRTTVRGIVSDSTGRPLQGADVSIISHKLLAKTDDLGRFSLRRVPAGDIEISVRRMGYEPIAVAVVVVKETLDTVRITMIEQPLIMQMIEINAVERQQRLWIEEFYRRRARGLGTFITRDEILARNTARPSDLLRTTPGVHVERRGVRFNYTTSIDARRDCPPMLWIDGQRAPGLELDALSLMEIEGIELYSGPSTTPTQFSQSLAGGISCGTIVVWSRPPNSRTP